MIRDIAELGGLETPSEQIEKLLETNSKIVIVVVSGCGKTRTCYDLAKKNGMDSS